MDRHPDEAKAADTSAVGPRPAGVSRREFARHAALVTLWMATATSGCSNAVADAFLQKNLREMTHDELKDFLARLERKYQSQHPGLKKSIEVRSTPPMEGVKFGYALDLSRCIGCRRCVHACVAENNQSRPNPDGSHNTPIEWIRVLEMPKDKGVDLAHGNAYYNPEEVPRDGFFYMPVQCQQCEDPPCVKVCPVGATWSEPDGIVTIDYDWCIGCRYCMVACPYGARHFNWAEPYLPDNPPPGTPPINPNTHVLGNRPRMKGVVEKCTFCIQRTRAGRYPACVEACPVGARKFGNLLDPKSEIRTILDTKRVFILKSELNTQPKFFYFFGV